MRTKDAEFINRIMRDDSVYPYITDDLSTPAERFSVDNLVNAETFYFISPNMFTVFVFMPINSITWEVHTCILKNARGKIGEDAARKATEYMFENTPCRKIISWVPEIYKHVLVFALRSGMKIEGVSKDTYLKFGKLHNMTLVGITKEEWLCQQQSQLQ